MKASMLKISTRLKRPASAPPLAEQIQAKVAKASSSTPSPVHKVVAPLSTVDGSDGDHIEVCSMLDVSLLLSSSSSSSGPSASKSIPASPPPIPNLVISLAVVIVRLELLAISEMSEPDMTRYTMELEETGSCAGPLLVCSGIDWFLFWLTLADLMVFDASTGGADAMLHGMTQGPSSVEVANEDAEIIDCLEHVSFGNCCCNHTVPLWQHLNFLLTHALILSKSLAAERVVDVV
jgi:hypothetical protein